MKSFLVVVFLILAVGTSVIGFLYFRDRFFPVERRSTVQAEKKSYEDQKNIDQDNREQDALAYNRAIADKDTAQCGSIVDEEKKSECKESLVAITAIEKKDKTLCDTLKNTDIQTKCHDKLTLESAEEKKDKTLCGDIIDTGSQSYCKESLDEARLRIILRDGTATEAICKTLETKFQDACLRSIVREQTATLYTQAVQGSSRESCELIPVEEERNLCLDTVNLREALTTGNTSLCDSLLQADKKTFCHTSLEKKDDATNFKRYLAGNDLEGCASLVDANLKNRCNDSVILSLVRMNKDTSLCVNLTNTGMVLTCHKLAE